MNRDRRPLAAQVTYVALLAFALGSPGVRAVDLWEPDATTYVEPGHPPMVRDLQSSGGVADVDSTYIITQPLRSYEARIVNARAVSIPTQFERRSYLTDVVLQSGTKYGAPGITVNGDWLMRWQTSSSTGEPLLNTIRVAGTPTGTASDTYTMLFRESTLFCPRFNNSGGQVSVLILQSAPTGTLSCEYSAHFFGEDGVLITSAAGTLTSGETTNTPMKVTSLPGIAALVGQKGSAQIAHTCGYGNLKAKLVALEPATGFSFDTTCSMREH